MTRRFRCDRSRLRRLLDDGLPEGERADLIGHLDDCGPCQRLLESLAAEAPWWRDLHDLPHQGPEPGPESPRDGHGGALATESAGGGGVGEGDPGLDFLAPPDDPDDLGRLGPYEVNGVLGRGGMGVVLRATDPALGRVVALKVLAPQLATCAAARKRFAREARAAAAVLHENVVAIHAVETDPRSGLPYLVMPYLAGRSLQERIDRDGPLEVKEVLRIGMQAALGLAAAHAQGLVHRDVKPSNILLENGVERVKLTDFGLARAVDDASVTQSGVVAGTPQYMAPEQARGEAVDHRADLFSLGSVLYAMCAGHPPFRAGTALAVLRRVSDERPRPVRDVNPEVPEWLEAIIETLHAKDPAGRFQSASEVARMLERHLAELQRRVVEPERRGPAFNRWTLKRVLRTAAVVAAALALFAVLGLVGVRRNARTPNDATLLTRDRKPSVPSTARDGAVSPVAQPGDAEPTEAPQRLARMVATDDPKDVEAIVGSGKLATKGWSPADFTEVEITHEFLAEVTRADRFSVAVTAADDLLEHVRVAKEGPRLRVDLEPDRKYQLRRDSLKVAITMPALASVELRHGARAVIRGFESRKAFEAGVHYGGALEGTIVARRILIEATFGSEVALKGSADDARLKADYGSRLPLDRLAIRDVDVRLDHGSTAIIDAQEKLDYSLDHTSNLKYLGQPAIGRAVSSKDSSATPW